MIIFTIVTGNNIKFVRCISESSYPKSIHIVHDIIIYAPYSSPNHSGKPVVEYPYLVPLNIIRFILSLQYNSMIEKNIMNLINNLKWRYITKCFDTSKKISTENNVVNSVICILLQFLII